jgi:hypothetical protein
MIYLRTYENYSKNVKTFEDVLIKVTDIVLSKEFNNVDVYYNHSCLYSGSGTFYVYNVNIIEENTNCKDIENKIYDLLIPYHCGVEMVDETDEEYKDEYTITIEYIFDDDIERLILDNAPENYKIVEDEIGFSDDVKKEYSYIFDSEELGII